MDYKPVFKVARNITGFTQEQIAVSLGVSASTISDWESGTADPRARQVVQLSKLYQISSDQLLGLKPIIAKP